MPKNDYEIVVPEDEQGMDGEGHGARRVVEDQADLDERAEWEKEQKRLAELKLRSLAVQRSLPRPYDVNTNIMRPSGSNDPPLTELQKVRQSFSKPNPTGLKCKYNKALYINIYF